MPKSATFLYISKNNADDQFCNLRIVWLRFGPLLSLQRYVEILDLSHPNWETECPVSTIYQRRPWRETELAPYRKAVGVQTPARRNYRGLINDTSEVLFLPLICSLQCMYILTMIPHLSFRVLSL